MIRRLLFFMLLIIGFNVYSVNALETLPGDIDGNGKIEPSDYLLIRKHLLSNPKLTGDKLKRADVNSDGKITPNDYAAIRLIALKIPAIISLNKTKLTLNVGKSEALKVDIIPSNALNKNVTWSSGNSSIATVDKNGKVTAKKKGTTTITVKANNGKIATCEVNVSSNDTLSYDYEKIKNGVKEVMKAYYAKGSKIQYNHAKATYAKESPEDATSQKTMYLVCGSFATTVQHEMFGMYDESIKNDTFPPYNQSEIRRGNTLCCNSEAVCKQCNNVKANELVYYSLDGNIKYGPTSGNITDSNYKEITKKLAQKVQPGDIVTYSNYEEKTGHSLVVYDVIKDSNGNIIDALLLNSAASGGKLINRISGTSRLFYLRKYGIDNQESNNLLNTENFIEGTVQSKLLSDVMGTSFKSTPRVGMIIRTYYRKNDGSIGLNYPHLDCYIKRSLLRADYPNLYIEKTVDKNDLNSVNKGDKLTYTIFIKNNSSITNQEKKNYKNLYLEETIDSKLVKLINADNNASVSGNKVGWDINLSSGKSIKLTYTVEVIGNKGNVIQAEGKVYNKTNPSVFITTSTVKNTIVSTKGYDKYDFEKAYNKLKGEYSGLELIDKIYEEVTGNGYRISDFKFSTIFQTNSNGTKNLKTEADLNYVFQKNYLRMILNNYYGFVYKKNNSNNIYLQALHSYPNKAKNINYQDFKNGDILIYYVDQIVDKNEVTLKYEKGLYAYIYINGVFKGVNNNSKKRDEYTYQFYKDKNVEIFANKPAVLTEEDYKIGNYQLLFDKSYYVILRPDML